MSNLDPPADSLDQVQLQAARRPSFPVLDVPRPDRWTIGNRAFFAAAAISTDDA